MTDPDRKPWYQQLPAKLAAGVVFLVALTTLVGNVMELDDKRRRIAAHEAEAGTNPAAKPAAAAPATTAPAAIPPPAPPAGPSKQRVAVERIVVQHDGSPGTTDWRFTVEADGEPLFSFGQDDLDDTGGRNVAAPRDASGVLRLEAGHGAIIVVKGWRGSRLRLPGGEPDATGQGMLTPSGRIAPVRVAAADAGGGEFTFHFSADPP